MVCGYAKIALRSFLLALLVFSSVECICIHWNISTLLSNSIILILSAVLLSITIKLYHTESDYFQVAIRAAFLGFIFSLGIYIRYLTLPHIQVFGTYMCVMSFFHFSEFFAIAVIQPKQVSTDSFVINHSPQYIVAAITSWLEFFIEGYLFPGLKQICWISNIGLLICIVGEVLRKTAMFTAGSNFHHLVQCEKSSTHTLVTNGVYSWFRHPSYVGWFYWSIGTQILLINPLCIPAYAVASWLFFKSRVYIEEITLLNFFGQNYCDYQTKVGTGLPFIDGPVVYSPVLFRL